MALLAQPQPQFLKKFNKGQLCFSDELDMISSLNYGAAAKMYDLTLPQNQQIAKQMHEKYHSLSLMLVKGPAAAKTGIFPAVPHLLPISLKALLRLAEQPESAEGWNFKDNYLFLLR